jgi:hypothetical protein
VRDDPSRTDQPSYCLTPGTAWILPEYEPGLNNKIIANNINIMDGASLKISGANSSITSNILQGDQTGILTLTSSQLFDATPNTTKRDLSNSSSIAAQIMELPFSLMIHGGATFLPPTTLACRGMNVTVHGTAPWVLWIPQIFAKAAISTLTFTGMVQ